MSQEELKSLRKSITEIDQRILELVAKRLGLAENIVHIKQKHGLPVKNYKVEKDVYTANQSYAESLGMYRSLAREITDTLIKYSVTKQQEDIHFHNSDHQPLRPHTILIIGGKGHMGQWLHQYFQSFDHQVLISDVDNQDQLTQQLEVADIAVLSTPIATTHVLLKKLLAAKYQGLVVDICSLKSPLLDDIHHAAKHGLKVTSIHPMFGPDIEFLTGQRILICSDPLTRDYEAQIKEFFIRSTAQLIEIPLQDHDKYVGYLLGLSHLINFIFASSLSRSRIDFTSLKKISSVTFEKQMQVTEQVVAENQRLYYDIQRLNSYKDSVIQSIAASFADFQNAILNEDESAFLNLVKKSQDYLGVSTDTD